MSRADEKAPEHPPSSRVGAVVVFGSCPPQTSHSSIKTLLLLAAMSWVVVIPWPWAVLPHPEDAALCCAMSRSPGFFKL